ncbi:hypothetical protein b3_0382 [Synechococcus phage B3]|jgi:hypothetical protein|nr:hypothetical protein b3_0382 [Synechococcus phage B3]QGT54982.1 hypothetical protein b23_0376 [Synechococcus phage B23]
MSNGFSNSIKVSLRKDGINELLKKYKNAKKIMKSNLYQVQVMDGTEKYISSLICEANENPPDL